MRGWTRNGGDYKRIMSLHLTTILALCARYVDLVIELDRCDDLYVSVIRTWNNTAACDPGSELLLGGRAGVTRE